MRCWMFAVRYSPLAACGRRGGCLPVAMADRAHQIARTLVARMIALQGAADAVEAERRQRVALVEKVLAVELGVTDGATVALVEAALPRAVRERVPDRELAGFADFLRQRLARQLEE